MIWEIHQQQRIASANRTAESAERKTQRTDDDLARLTRHVDRLTLACQSMWELLRETTGLTEEQLEERILEVDLRDGKADGKIARQIFRCASCGHNTNSKRSICVMCGAPVRKPTQFDG